MCFVHIPASVTLHKKVIEESTRNDKKSVTVMLAGLSDGTKLPQYMIATQEGNASAVCAGEALKEV